MDQLVLSNKELKSKKLDRINKIVNNNSILINNIIKYINIELKEDLYKEHKPGEAYNKPNQLLKNKSSYKQIINQLFYSIERESMKVRFLWDECERGQRLLEMKKASTVQSPNYGNECGRQENGYHANTQEQKLLAIEEEARKQQKRIIDYQLAEDAKEQKLKDLKAFVSLSPNTTGVEVVIRHYFNGEKYNEICDKLFYAADYLKQLRQRVVDDLTLILIASL